LALDSLFEGAADLRTPEPIILLYSPLKLGVDSLAGHAALELSNAPVTWNIRPAGVVVSIDYWSTHASSVCMVPSRSISDRPSDLAPQPPNRCCKYKADAKGFGHQECAASRESNRRFDSPNSYDGHSLLALRSRHKS
jgi:hypothetical protein